MTQWVRKDLRTRSLKTIPSVYNFTFRMWFFIFRMWFLEVNSYNFYISNMISSFLMNFLTCYPTILIDFFGVDSIGDSRIWSLPFIRSSKHLGISFLTLKWAFGSFMLVSPACLCLYGFAHVLRIGSVSLTMFEYL